MNIRSRAWFVLFIILYSTIPYFGVTSAQSIANWTVMYYICGDSNIRDYVDPLLENLSHISSTKNFNLIVFIDKYGRDDFHIYYIGKKGAFIEISTKLGWPSEVDTGDPDILKLFCTQMMRLYPAKHYALIPYASGGTGWQRFCLPDNHPKTHGVSLPNLSNALEFIFNRTHHKIDVMFGSCGTGVIELAYEVSPYVDYLVVTQDCISREHLVERFYQATWDVRNNSNLTPEEFGRQAAAHLKPEVFYYQESYYNKTLPNWIKILNNSTFKGLHTVLFYDSTAVINLSNINKLIESINSLGNYLIKHLSEKFLDNIKTARSKTREYGKCFPKFYFLEPIYNKTRFEFMAYDCFIDIKDFVEHLKKTTDDNTLEFLCNNIIIGVNETVSAIKKVPSDHSNGLSIYFPQEKILYNKYIFYGKIPYQYESLRFSYDTSWDEFLKAYLKI